MHAVRTDDVIVAVSTPAGRSARGIVRVTGPEAIGTAGALLRLGDGHGLAAEDGWQAIRGRLCLAEGVTVPAMAVVFRPPRSYTGQPLVELHVAGAPALLEMILRACVAAGARLAEPGEFTARAFLMGRMDLLSAEAVAQRIAARSDAQLAAAQQLAGSELSREVRSATEQLADLLSLVEAGIDFADEPIEFIDASSLAVQLEDLRERLEGLLSRSFDMQRLETLPRVALVGPPNAGKSRLLNRLTGLDRSICSPLPGTTRDVLSAVMDTPAGQVLLLDGPGLDESRDPLERAAQQAWRDLLGHADLLLLVQPADSLYDGRSGWQATALERMLPDIVGRPRLLVGSKQDLLDESQQAAATAWAQQRGPEAHVVSAATGFGCEGLRAAVGQAVAALESSAQGRIVLTARHGEALRAGLEAIRAAGDEHCAELVALHLREAMAQLGQITGDVTTEDLLERVFSRFCIGK